MKTYKENLNLLKRFMENRCYYILHETDEQVKLDVINDTLMCLNMFKTEHTIKDENNHIIICSDYGDYYMEYTTEKDDNEGLWFLRIVRVKEHYNQVKEDIEIKTYKDFDKIFIGGSDIATLIMVGCSNEGEFGLLTKPLFFGGDGSYKAYNVTEKDVEIPAHYQLIAKFDTWLKIYDDEELVRKIKADTIELYRCGDYGCIIKSYNL